MDPQGNTPVEYANIVLLDTLTRSMVTGIVSDSTGYFRMENIPYGIYFLEYSFIGYEKQRSKPVAVTRKNPRVDLGVLNLKSSAINMNEVTVTGEKTMMITKIDRKIFNVQNDISAQTGSVTDMLQTIPSVSVDMDGNISLRGSGNVTILINGRPSVMTGTANLEQMPASLVDRIEVITNPSAKYKPDGTAGIINIVLKKERKAGFNAILGANAGSNSRFNTNLQLNYNTGKVNLFGSYGFRQDYRYRTGHLYSQTIDTAADQSLYLEQSSNGTSRSLSHLGQLGFEWNITRKDAAGISGTYNYRDVKRNETTRYLYSDNEKKLTEDLTRYLDGMEIEQSAGLTFFYEHVFDREKEHVLRADFEYQQEAEKEDDNWTTNYALPDYTQGRDHTEGNNSLQDINLAISYTRPLWKDAGLETGYEGTMQITGQDQQVEHWDPESVQWVYDPDESNRYHATQTVHALYAILTCGWNNFNVMGGLRAEEALDDLEFRSADTAAKNNYFAIYPTLHLGYTLGKNEWQLNYSRRVNRPEGDDMNPHPEYRDPRNIFVGNPDLKPEDIHSVEAGYALKVKNLTLVPTLFYRYKVHGFTWITSNLNDTVLVSTIENLDKDQSAGLDLSGNWLIAKIANINFSASGYYSQIDASSIGYSSSKSTFSWNAKVNASFSITRSTLFQVNGQYRSEVLTPQGFRRPTWVVNLGFRQDLWKKRISLIATVSDLFNSQAWKNSVNTPILVQESVRRRDARVFYGGFVFSFGTNGKKAKEEKFEFDNGMDN